MPNTFHSLFVHELVSMGSKIHNPARTWILGVVDFTQGRNSPMLIITLCVFLECDLTLIIATNDRENIW
jgi:hypothetical protein